MDLNLTKIRESWKNLEGYHTLVYFAPEAINLYQQAGLDFILGYFASRSASMGKVSDKVVASCFYVFKPELVSMAIPKAWEIIEPEKLTELRYQAADAALVRILGNDKDSEDIATAATIARKIAESASDHFVGRPLFSGHCQIKWPTEPYMVLFHAQTLIREFRGDGHMISLVANEVGPLEALILHGAADIDVPISFLKSTRGWSDTEWNEVVTQMINKNLITKDNEKLKLTDSGSELKDKVESMTDRLSSIAYHNVSNDELDVLISVGKKIADKLAQANSFINK